MNARHMGWTGTGIAIAIGTIVAAGCVTERGAAPPPNPAADRGFNLEVDLRGCPIEAKPFGPSDSKCPPGNPADCLVVPHGKQVRFALPAGTTTEFALEFAYASGSPFEDGTLKAISRKGAIQKQALLSVPAKNVFPFRVLGLPGSGCPNVDPQIILN